MPWAQIIMLVSLVHVDNRQETSGDAKWPDYLLMSYLHPGSFGSLGSHGSCDGLGLGSSHGSHGDHGNFDAFYSPASPGMNVYTQSGISILGYSPDTRPIRQVSHGNGICFSPGNFAPMPLGSSPSQCTPPSSYGKISIGSPRQYGPPSPVRGNCHGSLLGKMASGSHYNRRKNWVYRMNFQSQETVSSSCIQGRVSDINTSCQSLAIVGSPSHKQANLSSSTRRSQQVGRSIISGCSSLHKQTVHGRGYDKSECSNSLPNPGDWDPNYSDELLLQEDSSDMSSMTSEFIKGTHLGRSKSTSNVSIFMQRHDGPVQALSFGEAGCNRGPAHMTNQSYVLSNLAQNSPSQLAQQPLQRHNLGRSAPCCNGDWSHLNVQASQYSGGLHSPGRTDLQWGRIGNYSVSNASAFHGMNGLARNA